MLRPFALLALVAFTNPVSADSIFANPGNWARETTGAARRDAETGLRDTQQLGRGTIDQIDRGAPWGDPHCTENPNNARCKPPSGRSFQQPAPTRHINVRGANSCRGNGSKSFPPGTTMCFGGDNVEYYCTGYDDGSGTPGNASWEPTGGRCRS